MSKYIVCLATLLAGVSLLTPVPAMATQPAISSPGVAVVNTKAKAEVAASGRHRFDLAFDVEQFASTRAKVRNEATAQARSCRDCRAVALSFQVVMLNGSSLQLQADNLGQAVNSQCVRCQSLAGAYQFVIASDEELWLDERAKQELAHISRRLADLEGQTEDLDVLRSQVDASAWQVLFVLQDAMQRYVPEPVATGPDAKVDRPKRTRPSVAMHRHVRRDDRR